MVYLGHILDMARRAINKAKGKKRRDFNRDEDLQIILVHLIQIIGEAARQVSDTTQKAYPAIPWEEIIGMRNRIVHNYINIKYEVVWKVVTNDLPPLVSVLERIIPPDNY